MLRLNLGCGPIQPVGWVNVDASMRARLASSFGPVDRLLTRCAILSPTEFNKETVTYDLLKPLPYHDGSVDAIYAGELWEHFEPEDALRLSKECFRVLRPGGVIRVCVPDGEEFWRNYLLKIDEELKKQPPERDVERVRGHVEMYFRDICTKRSWLKSFGHFHKWQYDEVQLVEHFRQCGFDTVERKKFRDSRIAGIADVERSDFLIVEAVRG